MTKFSERLRELRLENNLTVHQLAAAAHVSATAVSRWENKLRVPSIDNLYQLALYFKVSADYILGLTDY